MTIAIDVLALIINVVVCHSPSIVVSSSNARIFNLILTISLILLWMPIQLSLCIA